ncbi:hypothetical protein PAXRUDRAFT_827964 [Paxillus rubicundulus Ve08.2h10]|uniref:Unplaced genomic scaffold scaffold_282, whole genome shotgun sequence n=1 Tax=Paxillus rubicundulus Ve08.2h10 TaxID=930991 RepID=A0A0D0DWY7_9AGAM|nr:hypothetical protein PAXRUDRAFT_827964 [Paxillus rubicundulus Ve08.2h10]
MSTSSWGSHSQMMLCKQHKVGGCGLVFPLCIRGDNKYTKAVFHNTDYAFNNVA